MTEATSYPSNSQENEQHQYTQHSQNSGMTISSPSLSNSRLVFPESQSLETMRQSMTLPSIMRRRRKPLNLTAIPMESPPSSPKPLPLPPPDESEAHMEESANHLANDQILVSNIDCSSAIHNAENQWTGESVPIGMIGGSGQETFREDNAFSHLQMLAAQVSDASMGDQSIQSTPPRRGKRDTAPNSEGKDYKKTPTSSRRKTKADSGRTPLGRIDLLLAFTRELNPNSNVDLTNQRSLEENLDVAASSPIATFESEWRTVSQKSFNMRQGIEEQIDILTSCLQGDGSIILDRNITNRILHLIEEQKGTAGYIIASADHVLRETRKPISDGN
eukprot:TRINITY_DN11520_c0_g1_i1.p1 TRINITY_DN11520_c0_g1~~TRINITY_DN11520_c0_g1_i1.p1  ORF type:complete len:333 (-),score=60.12 TRINITY_DN11520_c0_g1_i1:27-1025(-)